MLHFIFQIETVISTILPYDARELREVKTISRFKINSLEAAAAAPTIKLKMTMTELNNGNENSQKDRQHKYGFGAIRLSFLLFIFYQFENSEVYVTIVGIRYGIFGIGGALLNLHKFKFKYELLILCGLIVNFIHEYVNNSSFSTSSRVILFMYFFKTLLGDAFAGKLDNVAWFKFISFVVIIWTVLSSQRVIPLLVLPNGFQLIEMVFGQNEKLLIFGSHILSHWLCEMGDNYYEKHLFFRHRYSYDISCLVLYFLSFCSNSNNNNFNDSRLLIFADMSASLLYRTTNFISLITMGH